MEFKKELRMNYFILQNGNLTVMEHLLLVGIQLIIQVYCEVQFMIIIV